MKYILSILFTVLLVFSVVQEVDNHTIEDQLDYKEIQDHIDRKENIQEYIEFKEKLAFYESTQNYFSVSASGTYWGKYQVGKLARRDVEMNKDRSTYLSSPLLQELTFYRLLNKNKSYLSKEIYKFKGDTIRGIPITESGILASSHLVGYLRVKQYLYTNGERVSYDGNGISLEKYLQEFSDFNFSLKNGILDYINSNYKI